MSNRDEWTRVEPLLDKALDLDPGERDDFVLEVAQQSRALAKNLKQLLDASEGAGSILIDRDLVDVAGKVVLQVPTEKTSGLASGAFVGPYRLLRKLGDGGAGQVFVAARPGSDREFALKILVSRESEPEFVLRFEREQNILNQLKHPHVVSASDHGVCEQGFRYLALNLIEGQPITDFCQVHKLDIGGKINVLDQVFSAVEAAHSAGVIHRDLKPSNILVEGLGDCPHAYVLDFGIARDTEPLELTMSGQIIGTPAYMSPEQARGESRKVDQRSDLFTLGVLTYEVLSGHNPFRRQSVVETLTGIIREEPTPLSQVLESTPQDLAAAVHRCLAKAPEDRFSTVSEFRQVLQDGPLQELV